MSTYLNRIKQFHGHIGPYVVFGYRIGKFAKKRVGAIQKTVVYTDSIPPKSCVLDGLQISTGCTFGKGNIKILSNKAFQKVVIYGKTHKIIIHPNQSILNLLEKSFSTALKIINKAKCNQLFDFKIKRR